MSDHEAKHNAQVACLLQIFAAGQPPGTDSRRHYENEARRYEIAGPRVVAPAMPPVPRDAGQ